MAEFDDLPPAERATRYRELAGDARLEAEAAKGIAHASYLRLAERWDKLATEADADARKPMKGHT